MSATSAFMSGLSVAQIHFDLARSEEAMGVYIPCGHEIALALLNKELGERKSEGTYQYPCAECGTEVTKVTVVSATLLRDASEEIKTFPGEMGPFAFYKYETSDFEERFYFSAENPEALIDIVIFEEVKGVSKGPLFALAVRVSSNPKEQEKDVEYKRTCLQRYLTFFDIKTDTDHTLSTLCIKGPSALSALRLLAKTHVFPEDAWCSIQGLIRDSEY